MKPWAAVAAALVALPAMLILDEPTRHLDLPAIKWLEDLLRNYGGSVLLVTHDLREAVYLADRILVLEDGAAIEQGTHDELVALQGYYAKAWRMQALQREIEES